MSLGKKTPAYTGLLVLSGLFAAGAAVTLVPWAAAPWPNLLGYRSVCPFAPGASLVCALAAGAVCTLRNRLVFRTRGRGWIPAVVLGLLLAGALASAAVWAETKARYTDTTASATAPAAP